MLGVGYHFHQVCYYGDLVRSCKVYFSIIYSTIRDHLFHIIT